MIYPKPYSIYFRGTIILPGPDFCGSFLTADQHHCKHSGHGQRASLCVTRLIVFHAQRFELISELSLGCVQDNPKFEVRLGKVAT